MAAICLGLGGCSTHPPGVAAPSVDPDDLSNELLSAHDSDGNGSLSAKELEELPAILDRMKVYDADGNGEVTLEELQTRLKRVFDGRTGLMAAAVRVTRNGKPFRGAIVHFVPLPMLEGLIPVASGVTLSNGQTVLSIRLEDLPPNSPQRQGFCQAGLYSVEVTHPDVKVPQQYNVKTTLGREISPEVALAGAIAIDLKF
jgi:hypothetical protein